MGFLGNLLKKIGGAAPTDMTFVPSVAQTGAAGVGDPIVADECYVSHPERGMARPGCWRSPPPIRAPVFRVFAGRSQ